MWWLAAGMSSILTTPLLAATRVTIHDLKEHPQAYDGQTVLLECYFDKESPIWVSALPDAEAWIGFFVTGKPEKALTWQGEYYNLLFAPEAMRPALRSLRGGDQITIIGEGFRYHSTSLDGVGIHVQQILQGWGPSSHVVGQAPAAGQAPPVLEAPRTTTTAVTVDVRPSAETTGKYTATINGKRYQGLRYGDRYNFDGIEFQVDQAQ